MEPLPVIKQLGNGFTVSVLLQELEHPFTSVTVAVYVPAVFTVIHCVVQHVLVKLEAILSDAHLLVTLHLQL